MDIVWPWVRPPANDRARISGDACKRKQVSTGNLKNIWQLQSRCCTPARSTPHAGWRRPQVVFICKFSSSLHMNYLHFVSIFSSVPRNLWSFLASTSPKFSSSFSIARPTAAPPIPRTLPWAGSPATSRCTSESSWIRSRGDFWWSWGWISQRCLLWPETPAEFWGLCSCRDSWWGWQLWRERGRRTGRALGIRIKWPETGWFGWSRWWVCLIVNADTCEQGH